MYARGWLEKLVLPGSGAKQVVMDGTAGIITAGTGANAVTLNGTTGEMKAKKAVISGTTIDNNGVVSNRLAAGNVEIKDDRISGINTSKITNNTDAANKEYVDNKIAASAKPTTLENGKNTIVEDVPNGTHGKKYKVNLADDITLGTAGNAVRINGTNGTIKAGEIELDGVNKTATVGDVSINGTDKKITAGEVVLDGTNKKATIGDVTVDGAAKAITVGTIKIDGVQNVVGGLSNKTWNVNNPQAVTGQAATEDQLKLVNDSANTKIADLENKGIDFEGNNGGVVHRNLGSKLTIKGGLTDTTGAVSKNLGVKKNGDGLEIVMSENPEFNSVVAGTGADTKVTIGDTGVAVGTKTYITKDGINANG